MYTRDTISIGNYPASGDYSRMPDIYAEFTSSQTADYPFGGAARRRRRASKETGRRRAAKQQRTAKRSRRLFAHRKGHGRRRVIALLLIFVIGFTAYAMQGNLPYGIVHFLRGNGSASSLETLAERQPEARSFVEHYKDHKGEYFDPGAIDISQDLAAGGVPHFLQWDERWGYAGYGDDFLAVTGCGPTCLSMVLCQKTGDSTWNPLAVARYAEEHGYYVSGEGTAWALMSDGATDLGLSVYGEYPTGDNIRAELACGKTIICSVVAGDFTTSGHFIVLTGLAEDGSVMVNDPNSIARSERTWDAQRIADQTAQMWVYE